MNPTVDPKIVLITGTSSGFGLLSAARLASRGHIVYATMRNPDKQVALQEAVRKKGGQIQVMALDVTDKTSIRKAVEKILKDQGKIEVLINNAGFGVGGFFEDLTDRDIRQQFEVNFFGVLNCLREVIPSMRARRQGTIINISSVSGFQANPCFGAYSSSKWALEAFTESLFYELQLFGIRVHLVEPGTFRTKIFHENARYAENFDNPLSPYFAWSQFLRHKMMAYVENCNKDPEMVAAPIEKIVRNPRMPFRNIPDFEGRFLYTLRRILPFGLYSAVVRKFLFGGFNKDDAKG